jgi:general secretion pathway protein I
LEVLVALAVLAIAMAALIKGGADNAYAAAYLRDKTLAQWVAMNVIAEQRLADSWPDKGKQRGQEEMARHEWFWELTVAETFDEDIRRLEVAVRSTEESDAAPVVSLVAFLARPSGASSSPGAPSAQGAGGRHSQ